MNQILQLTSRRLKAAQRPTTNWSEQRRIKGSPDSDTCWSRGVHIDPTILGEESGSCSSAVMDVRSLSPTAGLCWLRSITIKLQKSSSQRLIDGWTTKRPRCIQPHQTPFTKHPFCLVFFFWTRRAWIYLSLTLQDWKICKLNFSLSLRSIFYNTEIHFEERTRKCARFQRKSQTL